MYIEGVPMSKSRNIALMLDVMNMQKFRDYFVKQMNLGKKYFPTNIMY